MTINSSGWDLRNLGKFSPKITKEAAMDVSHFFKNSPCNSNECLYSLGHLFIMSSKLDDWELTNIGRNCPGMIKKPFLVLLIFLKACLYDLNEITYNVSAPYQNPFTCNGIKIVWSRLRNETKRSPKVTKNCQL